MNRTIVLVIICLFLCGSCWLTREIDTRQFTLKEMTQYTVPLNGWITAGLKDESEDFFICHSQYNEHTYFILVQDIKGKTISQINLPNKIIALNTLIDKRNNDRWLFISSNDSDSLYLMGVKYIWQIPLRREDKYFSSLERTDSAKGRIDYIYNGSISPIFLEDIDNDGKMDLLCKLIDSFTAKPRGLILYDFETGSIKWRYDLPCNPKVFYGMILMVMAAKKLLSLMML